MFTKVTIFTEGTLCAEITFFAKETMITIVTMFTKSSIPSSHFYA